MIIIIIIMIIIIIIIITTIIFIIVVRLREMIQITMLRYKNLQNKPLYHTCIFCLLACSLCLLSYSSAKSSAGISSLSCLKYFIPFIRVVFIQYDMKWYNAIQYELTLSNT